MFYRCLTVRFVSSPPLGVSRSSQFRTSEQSHAEVANQTCFISTQIPNNRLFIPRPRALPKCSSHPRTTKLKFWIAFSSSCESWSVVRACSLRVGWMSYISKIPHSPAQPKHENKPTKLSNQRILVDQIHPNGLVPTKDFILRDNHNLNKETHNPTRSGNLGSFFKRYFFYSLSKEFVNDMLVVFHWYLPSLALQIRISLGFPVVAVAMYSKSFIRWLYSRH